MKLRKLVTIIEETTSEGGRPVDPVHRVAIVARRDREPVGRAGLRRRPRAADRRGGAGAGRAAVGALRRGARRAGRGVRQGGPSSVSTASSSTRRASSTRSSSATSSAPPPTPRRCCRRSRRWRPPAPVFDIPLKHVTDATIRSHHQSVDRLRPRRAARRRARDRPRRRQPRPTAGAARAAVDRAVIDGPVLLLHGVGLDRTVWDPVVALLDGADVTRAEPARPRRRPAGRPGHPARPGARRDRAERTWSASRSAAWSPPASRPTGPTSCAR